MREDHELFVERNAKVVAIGPHSREEVASFSEGKGFPFPLLADPDHQVFDAYDVQSRMASLGQRPAVFVVDAGGTVRFDSIGTQQWQIPTNDSVLKVLDGLA